MKTILLYLRRILLAALGVFSVISFAGAVITGHRFGMIAWSIAILSVLSLSAVLFIERFLAAPVAVVSEVTGLLKNLPNSLAWIKDLLDDKAKGVIPSAAADALAKEILAKELAAATAPTATGGPVA